MSQIKWNRAEAARAIELIVRAQANKIDTPSFPTANKQSGRAWFSLFKSKIDPDKEKIAPSSISEVKPGRGR